MFIFLGLTIITIIVFIQNVTTTQEEDYYLTREVLEASMIDAIDMSAFRANGEIVMVREKFVEVFLRRFAESVGKTKESYKIEFYDISEYPPKASVRILTNSGEVSVSENANNFEVDLNTYLTGILEATDTYLQYKSDACREVRFDENCCVVKYENTDNTNAISNYCEDVETKRKTCCKDAGISKCGKNYCPSELKG